MGEIGQIHAWQLDEISKPRMNYQEIHAWSEQVSEYLNKFPKPDNHPPLKELLTLNGVLNIERVPIDANRFEVSYSEKHQAHKYEIEFKSQEKVESEQTISQDIVPGIGYLVLESQCTNCGEAYETCKCSSLLDQASHRKILNASPFPFWTDKSLHSGQ